MKKARHPALLRAAHADKQYPRLKAMLKRALDNQVRDLADRIEAADNVESARAKIAELKAQDSRLRTHWARDLARTLTPYIRAMAGHGWQLAGEEFKAQDSGLKTEASGKSVEVGDWDNFLQRGDWRAVERWIDTTAESASNTTAANMARIFTRAADAWDEEKKRGMTPPEIAAQLLTEGVTQDEARARMLAHTGAIWSYNEGATQRYAAEGVAVVEWLTADDDLRCEFCAEMNGKRIETGERFFHAGDSFSAGGGSMKIPGSFDVRHPPLHPNCRCTLIPIVDERQLDQAEPEEPAPEPTPQRPLPTGTQIQVEAPTPQEPKPEPPAPTKIGEHPQAAAKTLQQVEGKIAAQNYETLAVINDTGQNIFEKDGGRRSVSFSRKDMELMRDAVVTHNHPSGSSFSTNDIRVLFRSGAKEMRAVGKEYQYTARRAPDVQQVSELRVVRAYNKASKRIGEELLPRVRALEMTPRQYAHEVSHRAWTEVAAQKEYGLQYERRQNGGRPGR